MTDPLNELRRLVTLSSNLDGDTPIKFDSLRDELVDANEDRKMHWWTSKHDEFYAAARNLDLPAILAAMEQAKAALETAGIRPDANGNYRAEHFVGNGVVMVLPLAEWVEARRYAADKIIASQARIAELEKVVEKLPKTKDGVPVYPGLHVWFRSRSHPDNDAYEMKVTGWNWLPRLGEGFMHAIDVVTETGEDDMVNLECCYSTREAALDALDKEAGDAGGQGGNG